MSKKTTALIATLDTKGPEVAFVRQVIESMGAAALIIDTGILGDPAIPADITREEVALASGTPLAELIARGDKGGAIAAMTHGAAVVAKRLHAEGKIQGIMALGGVQGTTIGTAAMRALPLGVPKLMVSTVACGNATFGPFVGTSDVAMLHSVADIAGVNAVSRTVFSEAAGGIVGMMNAVQAPRASAGRAIGLTMVGITTTGATEIKRLLENYGHEVITFHGNGVGPQAMEELVEAGVISAVVDFSPHDATDYIWNGLMPAHAGRFQAQVARGVPIVLSPGATDLKLRGPWDSVPRDEQQRKHVKHNAIHSHIRTSVDEMRAVGRFVGERLANAAHVVLFVPKRGYSQLNREGGPMYDPESDRAWVEGFRAAAPNVKVVEMDNHINDLAFAAAVAEATQAMIVQTNPTR